MSRDRRWRARALIQKGSPVRVFFGFDEIEELIALRDRGEPFLFCDHAYFERGYEKANFRAVIGGIHQLAVKDCPTDRLKRFGVRLKGWREPGREVIVIPAAKNPLRFHGEQWAPAVGDWPSMTKRKEGPPLSDVLKRARCLVSHVSVAAVEAACAGVAVVVSPHSPAWPVSSPSLEQLCTPERQQWAASLTYSQFTLSELSDGSAWKMLNEYHPCGTENGAPDVAAPQGCGHGRL